MGNIGSSELFIILLLALLLLGPKRLPEVGEALGRSLRRFRRASRELRDELEVGRDLDLRRQLDIRRDLEEVRREVDIQRNLEEVRREEDARRDHEDEKPA